MKKIDINFLVDSVCYFRDFRIENLQVFNNFYKRLDGFFNNTKYSKRKRSINLQSAKNFFLILSSIIKQVFRIPKYVIQTWMLRRYHCEQIKTCEAFCIASSRLNLDEGESVVSQLERLTEALGGGHALNLFADNLKSENTVLLYDPQIQSGFWKINKRFNNEKIYIFDGAFIIFFSIHLLITGIFLRSASELIFIKEYLKHSKIKQHKNVSSFFLRIIEALVFTTYFSLVDRLPKHTTTFLTSNSFLVELLRTYLLQDDKSEKIIELLHGIIANPTEKWFKRILAHKEDKHYLIPQVPNLPELETLTKEFFIGNNISINCYLNSSLYENKKNHGSYEAFAFESFKMLGINPDDKILTVTIYGGTSINDIFFESSAFEIEIEILYKTIKYFKDRKTKIKIIYVPHPSNKNLPKSATDKLLNLDVQILENSIFTYLISDYCISNISSCLFELDWLGAQSFSPLIEEDGLYSSSYLKTIHHPQGNGVKALENSLYNCFDEGIKKELKTFFNKFDSRIKKIKGTN